MLLIPFIIQVPTAFLLKEYNLHVAWEAEYFSLTCIYFWAGLKKVCEPEGLSSIPVLSIELVKNTSSLHDLDNIFKKYVSNVVGCYWYVTCLYQCFL